MLSRSSEEKLGSKRNLQKVKLDNAKSVWSSSSSQYVRTAVKNVDEYLKSNTSVSWKVPAKAQMLMWVSYRPELDVSLELNHDDASYYQMLIGVLRWIVELGRVDICLEVSMLSSHLALPCEGHLEQVFQIFAYLKKYHNTELVYDPSNPEIDPAQFEQRDWTSSKFGHVDGEEELSPNMPELHGMGFTMRTKVDADHASNTVTRRSRTGFLAYLYCALVYWWSKKQMSVVSSSFGAEFIVMRQCCEYLGGWRYKL